MRAVSCPTALTTLISIAVRLFDLNSIFAYETQVFGPVVLQKRYKLGLIATPG